MWPGYPVDGPPWAHTTATVDGCNRRLLDVGLPPELRSELDEILRQRVATKLTCAALAALRAEAGPADISRLRAASAPSATALWNLVPSLTLDNALAQADFIIAVKLRLGVDVRETTGSCRFCGWIADAGGRRALSCTSEGTLSSPTTKSETSSMTTAAVPAFNRSLRLQAFWKV